MSCDIPLAGDRAPKLKNIRKYLNGHPDCEPFDSENSTKADVALVEDACQHACRVVMGHTTPDWKDDPRCKEESADPLAYKRFPKSFKFTWREEQILKLDYNSQNRPLLLKVPINFLQDAFQANVLWDDVKEDKREIERKVPRKIFQRPSWPPVLPANPSGCARAEAFTPRSFTEKAEFTHMAQESFPRICSGPEYKAMDINAQFEWMKANQNRRLVLGRSGIEGYGIFAKQPIFKVTLSGVPT
eukprot:746962-Hanusia_phi.AAC.4